MNQAKLETEMQQLGTQRALKRDRESKQRGMETGTRAGARLLRDLGSVMVKAIEDWKAEASVKPGPRHRALEHIKKIPSKTLASFTLKTVLDCLSRDRSFTSTAMMIGTRVEDEDRYVQFSKLSKISFDRAVRRADDFHSYSEKRRHILRAMSLFGCDTDKWPQAERAAVGVVLLQLCVDHCGLLITYSAKVRRHSELRIAPTKEAVDWAEDLNNRSALMSPMTLPFVEPPLDWRDPLSGGYHTTNIYSTAIVKTNDRRYLDDLMEAAMPEVYQSLNILQQTRWAINPEVFEMFQHYWGNGIAVPGLPSRDRMVIPPKPADIDTNLEARKAWRVLARDAHDTNNRRMADRLAMSKVHWVSERYKDAPFWFCYQLDWRGRAYPVSYFLHPQGGDMVKALLQFADGKPVTTPDAIRWHSIHGANCWGLDKKPYAERTLWVKENRSWLMQMATDPFEHKGWMEASDPWQFLAWLLDWYQVQTNPEHLSHLVIHQDATQSGIQIYSLMLRDYESAVQTNVVPSDVPHDLYQCVVDAVNERLRNDENPLAAMWLNFGLDRACAKRPVMTRVYNATRHSARVYVGDWAAAKAEKENKPIPTLNDGTSSLWFLTDHLWKATDTVIKSTAKGQQWLGEVAKVFADQGLSIKWTTPTGFPVRQWYPKWKSSVVKTSIGEKYRQTSVVTPGSKVDLRRMLAGFAPNFIHSLDSSAMMLTVVNAAERGASHLAAVHDSFGTHAADSETLAQATRDAYVEIFSVDLLDCLKRELQAQVPKTPLPPLPAYGTLDIQILKNSLYFFS